MLRPFLLTIPMLLAPGCHQFSAGSAVKVSETKQTPVKAQSIGNCWIFASAAWVESLHLTTTGKAINISESYWTYWHWYEQLLSRPHSVAMETGGTFAGTKMLVTKYGYMLEEDFAKVAHPADPKRDETALNYIHEQLAEGGALSDPASRTEENIKKHLDEAFGARMTEIESRVKDPATLEIDSISPMCPKQRSITTTSATANKSSSQES